VHRDAASGQALHGGHLVIDADDHEKQFVESPIPMIVIVFCSSVC
jgi:hypothetical protein